ncbi:MAG TPA: hypothetical protein VGV35_09980 [Bryobacteraceae bacterium]|nr:hypothetical protein [Bryobacteraceae bacterium]
MPEAEAQAPKKPRIGLILILLLAAFLVGFIPQWMKARDQSAAREKAEHQLTLTRIVKDLGSAAIDARRAEYEPARVEASAFFTAANFEIDQRDKSVLSLQQRSALAPLIASRDEVITLLARNDPASAEKLSNLYAAVRKVLGI